MKKTENGTNKSISFSLLEIKKIRFYQSNYLDFGLSKEDVLKGNLKIGVNFELSPNEEIISLFLKLDFCHADHELFGIETIHKYKIKDFKNTIQYDENKTFNVPDEIMKLWIGIAISDTRGMLVILNSDSEYSRIILPLINLDAFLRSIKKSMKIGQYSEL